MNSTGAEEVVEIRAEVFAVDEKGEEQILAKPILSVRMGEEGSLEDLVEYYVPSAFSEARLIGPSEHWNEVVIPAQPTRTEKKSAGLVMTLAPRKTERGDLAIDCQLKFRVLEELDVKRDDIPAHRGGPERKGAAISLSNRTAVNLIVSEIEQAWTFLEEESNWKSGQPTVVKRGAEAVLTPQVRLEANIRTAKESTVSRDEHLVRLRMRVVESDEPLDTTGVILSNPQYENWVRSTSEKKGTDLLAAPSVTIPSGLDGTIEVTREFIYPVAYDPPETNDNPKSSEPFSFAATPSTPSEFQVERTGIMAEFKPLLTSRGTIRLESSFRVSEFEGFTNFGEPIYTFKHPRQVEKTVIVSENRVLAPSFLNRAIETTTELAPDETMLVGGVMKTETVEVEESKAVLGDLPVIGKHWRTSYEETTYRYLYFLITPQLIERP
ncbi:MAG: hypothetical protein AAGC68_02460 [Verrucomicrobiota bacterium]